MEIVSKPMMMICWSSESIDPAEMEGQVNEGNIRLPPLPIPAQLPFFININTFVTCLVQKKRNEKKTVSGKIRNKGSVRDLL